MGKNKEISIFWITVKFVTPVVVILSFLPGPNGKKIIDWSDMLPSQQVQKKVANMINVDLPELSLGDMETPFAEKKTTIYKWQDEKGRWHFSEGPPMNKSAEKVVVSNKVNTMPAPPKIDNQDNSNNPHQPKAIISDDFSTSPGITSVPIGRVKKLMQDAQKMQQVNDDRAQILDNL